MKRRATTAELVDRFQRGQKRAGDFLARRFHPFVRQRAESVADERVNDLAFVQDLTQVGLIAAIASARKYVAGPQTPEKFARPLIDYAMRDYLKNWIRPIASIGIPSDGGAAAFLARDSQRSQLHHLVSQAVADLTHTEYIIARHRIMPDDPLSRSDLAIALGLSVEQVRAAEKRATWVLQISLSVWVA